MLAKRIQEAREQKSMSKAELARRVNVSRASVSMWEDGKNISISNIIKIAEVLDVTPEWLQYGVENESVKIEDLLPILMEDIIGILFWNLRQIHLTQHWI